MPLPFFSVIGDPAGLTKTQKLDHKDIFRLCSWKYTDKEVIKESLDVLKETFSTYQNEGIDLDMYYCPFHLMQLRNIEELFACLEAVLDKQEKLMIDRAQDGKKGS
jgi:hypothetical protein